VYSKGQHDDLTPKQEANSATACRGGVEVKKNVFKQLVTSVREGVSCCECRRGIRRRCWTSWAELAEVGRLEADGRGFVYGGTSALERLTLAMRRG
jgi:hypothetical protein